MKKLTDCQITSKRFRSYPDRRIENGCNVFPSSSVANALDEFYNDNAVYGIRFKSKVFAKMKRIVSALEIAAMREVFGKDVKISYSDTAGCSCGCSPGFRVRGFTADADRLNFSNHDIFVALEIPADDFKAALPKFKTDLLNEIRTHA